MKNKILLLTALLIISSIFNACKDTNEPTPVTNDEYFGTGNGSIWTYSNTIINADGTEGATLSDIDTLKQIKDSTYLTKASHYMSHKFLNPVTDASHTGNYFIYEDGNKLYVSNDFIKIFMPDILQTALDYFGDDEFYLLADGGAKESWKLMSMPLDNISLNLSIVNVILNGDLAFEVVRGKDTTIQNTKCNTYTVSIQFHGNVPNLSDLLPNLNLGNMVDINNVQISIIAGEVDFYLSQNKGLIGIYSKPMELKAKLPILGEKPIPGVPTSPGFKKILINSILQ